MVSERVDDYIPASIEPHVWEQIAGQARAWASAVPTEVGRQAVQRLKPLAQYLAWRIEGGLDVSDAQQVFRSDHIDWFVTDGCSHLAKGTRGTYRSALRTIGEWAVGGEIACPDRTTPIARPEPYTPYSAHEQAAILAAISGQTTGFRRHNAMALAAPSRGAGLRTSDIASLVGTDVDVTGRGVLINVPGPRPRRVPVLARWEEEVARLAELSGDRPLFRSSRTAVNYRDIGRFCERLVWTDAPAFSVSRMRVTWMVEHLAARTPLPVLAEAAGVSPENVARYAQFVPRLADDDCMRVLRRPVDQG